MKAALLPDRGVVRVGGDEARTFLNGLLTSDVDRVTTQSAVFAALLTPQGKIIVDCIVASDNDAKDAVLIDCPSALAQTLADRLKFYKLRAKVTIEDLSAALGVLAIWDGTPPLNTNAYADPRLPALGARMIVTPSSAADTAASLGATIVEASAYDEHRIALGVPRGGADFIYGDAFPHEADMDQLNGIDFAKGCYVGQEVVSRMEHRGTARTRIVPITIDGSAPETGLPVLAGEKQVGTTGSASGNHGLAMLRLDRVADAQASGATLTAGGMTIHVHKPKWARFAFPGDKAAE